MSEFSNLRSSFLSLFRMIMGDFDFASLEGVEPTYAAFYFIFFIVLVVLLMLNMILAIVMKTYDQVAQEVPKP